MSPEATKAAKAREIMLEFAERTGLVSDRPPRRYLWTDAFAVCNFLGIYRKTEEALNAVGRHEPWKEEVLSFWAVPAARETTLWRDHRDINEVMLATALFPDWFL